MQSEKPPLFDSFGALGGTDDAGFYDLYNIIDQIKCNFNIIRHDNAALALDHYVSEFFYHPFQDSRSNLRRRYQEKPRGITGHNPKILSDEKKNAQAYHALIDFIFQSLAWWLIHVAESKSWHAPIIAVLARWSVKLKFIALDPIRWAEQALARGEDVMRKISNDQKDEDRISIEFPTHTLVAEPKNVHFPADQDVDHTYYVWKLHLREGLYNLVSRVLNNLIAETSNNRRSTAFEVRTLIYRGDLDELLRQLTVRRDGTVETSSDLMELRHSYRALQLLLWNTQSIPQTHVEASSSETAKIDWHIKLTKDSDADVGSVTTARLDDVVSVLVPLSLMGGSKAIKSLDNPLLWSDSDYNYFPATLELSAEESQGLSLR